MRAVLAVLVPLLCAGSAAFAQAPAPAISTQAAAAGATPTPAGAQVPVKAAKRARNGGARRVAVADRRPERQRATGTVEEALTSCLAMWEPATHMTKGQWARACRRVAGRLRDA